jgi:hypothetical protein
MTKEWAAERVADDVAFHSPWHPTAEQWERDGHYAPFVAWETWMGARMENSSNSDTAAVWDEMDTLVRIQFWSAMCDACAYAAEKAKVPA